jgi:hypothetical protein
MDTGVLRGKALNNSANLIPAYRLLLKLWVDFIKREVDIVVCAKALCIVFF